MSETKRDSMAIVPFQEHIPTSCSSPKLNFERPPKAKDKSFCLRDITNVVSADTMKSECDKQKRCKKTTVESLHNTSEAQSVLERAKKLEANLAPEFPRVAKVLRPSNVTGCFCLSLPRKFCSENLPKEDTMIVLEDESGREFQTKYLVGKGGLSAGWRGFSISHKLLAGDIVVFHRVTPSKFKVYIVRSNGLDEADCALGIRQMDGDAIRACKITTSESDFSTWDKTLQACEMLGINVGFLRTRLNKLASLASELKQCSNPEGDKVASEVKLLGEKETTNWLDSEMDTQNMLSERLTVMFQEVARAAW